MNDMDLDTILAVVSNPVRRSILRKLAREMHYPLQLSRELNISQQSIMKHLKVLEDNNLVMVVVQKSGTGGPPRKYYVSTGRFSIVIDIAPSVFNEEIRVFEIVVEEGALPASREEMDSGELAAKKGKLMELATEIDEINQKLHDVEEERRGLMQEKERRMKEVYELLELLCEGYEERKVLRYILEEDNISIGRMSEMLNMREMDIESIMRRLEDLGLLELHRKIIYM
ncbi:MAG: helix-turn-helix domain-containing protein [Thermoplasmata archaeon]|nr:helix-turn-helix domain-containing protein [Thermoplasmata archaeon]